VNEEGSSPIDVADFFGRFFDQQTRHRQDFQAGPCQAKPDGRRRRRQQKGPARWAGDCRASAAQAPNEGGEVRCNSPILVKSPS